MAKNDIVSPICLKSTNSVNLTLPWFVQTAEYVPAKAAYAPLVNGEVAFGAVYEAIQNAKKTVDIICWGFQPSMFFVRKGDSKCIGELLEEKAKKGVQVRVLGWAMRPAGINVSGAGGESNAPGLGTLRIKSHAMQQTSVEQYQYDINWFSQYGDSSKPWKVAQENWCQPLSPRLGIPLRFIGRGFDISDRTEIFNRTRLNSFDKNLSKTANAAFAATVTHHQKMVLIDYEEPKKSVGFVMGHNMLDEYWDTNQHSIQRFPGNKGSNGALPRQDISSRVTGPILAHLHHNFATAWQKETGEDLMGKRKAEAIACEQLPRPEGGSSLMVAQILRTQSQENRQDIEALYLQAVNNATSFIYIENQYFRWTPLVDKLKSAYKKQKDCGRKAPIYLFVVTNASDEGVGPGTYNTARMLNSLGKGDTMPKVAREVKLDEQEEALQQANLRWMDARLRSGRTNQQMNQRNISPQERKQFEVQNQQAQQDVEQYNKEINDIKAKQKELRDPNKPIEAKDISDEIGIKSIVCTLVAPDSKPTLTRKQHVYAMGSNQEVDVRTDLWTPVYIHSKLMTVNDAFTTHGSANINTRSMEVDSELNIAFDMVSVTRKLRRELWNLHTNGRGVFDNHAEAYKAWDNIISNNKKAQKEKTSPVASLVEFYRDSPSISKAD